MLRFTILFFFSMSVFASDDFNMYFFKFYISDLTNIEDAKSAQAKLCGMIDKNCELKVTETINEYSVLPLYSEPDEKSKVIGAFVNARSREKYCAEMLKGDKYLYGKDHHDTEHCFESAFASFIVNKNGVKKNLTHYVSMASNIIDPKKFDQTLLVRRDNLGSSMKAFFRYLRVMDVKNKKIISFYEPREDNWYAFANPDESGTMLWFKFKSDLRSPKYAYLFKAIETGGQDLKLTKSFFLKYVSDEMKSFYKKHTNKTERDFMFVGYNFCSIKKKTSELISIQDKENFNNRLSKDYMDPCQDKSNYVLELPTSSFYLNGFLTNSSSLIELEDNEWVEDQKFRKEKGWFHKKQIIKEKK